MKNGIKLIIIFFLFSSFIHKKHNTNKVNNILVKSIVDSYKAKGVDILSELNKLESYLIEKETLESSSGQSYYNFFVKMTNQENLYNKIDMDKFSAIFKLKPNEFYSSECMDEIHNLDFDILSSSKFIQLSHELTQYGHNNIASPDSVAKIIIKHVKAQDFDKEYFRMMGLLTIAYVCIPVRTIEKKSHSISYYENVGDHIILINATKDKKIILDGSEVSKDLFYNLLSEKITKNKLNHMLMISSDLKTPYGFYLRVQNYIEDVYKELRNKESMNLFAKEFYLLNKEQQNQVIMSIPVKVKEHTKE